jgi:hypothetical protein
LALDEGLETLGLAIAAINLAGVVFSVGVASVWPSWPLR